MQHAARPLLVRPRAPADAAAAQPVPAPHIDDGTPLLRVQQTFATLTTAWGVSKARRKISAPGLELAVGAEQGSPGDSPWLRAANPPVVYFSPMPVRDRPTSPGGSRRDRAGDGRCACAHIHTPHVRAPGARRQSGRARHPRVAATRPVESVRALSTRLVGSPSAPAGPSLSRRRRTPPARGATAEAPAQAARRRFRAAAAAAPAAPGAASPPVCACRCISLSVHASVYRRVSLSVDVSVYHHPSL